MPDENNSYNRLDTFRKEEIARQGNRRRLARTYKLVAMRTLYTLIFVCILAVISLIGLQKSTEIILIDGVKYSPESAEVLGIQPFTDWSFERSCGDIWFSTGELTEACLIAYGGDPIGLISEGGGSFNCLLQEGARPIRLDIGFAGTYLGKLTNNLTCDMIPLSTVLLYDYKTFRNRIDIFNTEFGTWFTAYPERFRLYYLNEGGINEEDGRFLLFEKSPYRYRLVAASNASDIDWGYVKPPPPPPTAVPRVRYIPVGDSRWNNAAIALGRAGASGCGEFRLSTSGLVTCGGGARWRIGGSRAICISRC